MSTDDFPDNATTTGLLTNGGKIRGTIETVGDIDWVRLALDPERAYLFTATTTAGTEPVIYIIDAADPLWPRFTNQQGLLSSDELANPFALNLPGHQYYLRVENPAATAYTIGMTAMADDYGNSSASARALAVGGSADAFFDYSFDHEHYSIAATAGLTYTVTISADTMSSDAWLLAYNDVEQNEKAYGLAQGGSGTKSLTMSFLATESRIYDITVAMPSYAPPAGPVHYQVKASAADATAPVLISTTSTFDGPIRITFDEEIRLGGGEIRLYDSAGAIADMAASVDGKTLILNPGVNLLAKQYTVQIAPDAITDVAGNVNQFWYWPSFAVTSATHGNLVGRPSYSWRGDTYQGTDGTFDVVVYAGKADDYKFTIVNGNVDVAYNTGYPVKQDLLINVERVYFEKSADVMAFSLDGDLGQLYRLYQAAFDRTPDKAGLGFWTGLRDDGMALHDIAREFIGSKEFTGLYGANSSNAAFVEALYENALHRPGEEAGVNFWTGALDQGVDRASVLIGFSESAENQQAALATLGNGFSYTPYG